jgi:hypothetical protein
MNTKRLIPRRTRYGQEKELEMKMVNVFADCHAALQPF